MDESVKPIISIAIIYVVDTVENGTCPDVTALSLAAPNGRSDSAVIVFLCHGETISRTASTVLQVRHQQTRGVHHDDRHRVLLPVQPLRPHLAPRHAHTEHSRFGARSASAVAGLARQSRTERRRGPASDRADRAIGWRVPLHVRQRGQLTAKPASRRDPTRPPLLVAHQDRTTPGGPVPRGIASDVPAAEQTAHPTAVCAGAGQLTVKILFHADSPNPTPSRGVKLMAGGADGSHSSGSRCGGVDVSDSGHAIQTLAGSSRERPRASM
jgi:hypothetical protein